MRKLFTNFKIAFLTLAIVMGSVSLAVAQVNIESGADVITVIKSYMDEDGMLSENEFILQRSGVYFMSETIYTNDNLFIHGEAGDDDVIPAMIIPRAAPDGNYVDTWFVAEGIGTTFEATNTVFQMLSLSAMETGLNINTLIIANGENQRIIFDKLVVNGAGNNVISSAGDGQYIKVTNCNIRNNRNLSDDWSGGLLYGNWSAGGWRDSLIIRNNSFINIGNVALRCFTGETSRAVIVDHNTFFGAARIAVTPNDQSNVQLTNNMIVASHASGNPKTAGTAPDITIWGETVTEAWDHKGAMFLVGLLDAAAYPHLESVLGFDVSGTQESIEEQRSFVIANNCCYWPKELIMAWDTIDEDGGAVVPVFRTDAQGDWIFEHIIMNEEYDNSYGHMGSSDALTSEFNPGFDQASVNRILDPMNTWIDGFRNVDGWVPFMCNIDDPGKEIQLVWPLPENLAYTNEELKTGGTDGLPIGDLNWFGNPDGIGDITAIKAIHMSNHPNPFTSFTDITYTLKENSNVKMTIYNIVGEEVAVLVNDKQQAGNHTVKWNPSTTNLAAGIYLCKIQAGSYEGISKIIYNRN